MDNAGVSCEPVSTCPLCGSPGPTLYAGLRDHLFGAPGTWDWRACPQPACGVGWLDPRPLTAELGKLYTNYYTHTAGSDQTDGDVVPSGGGGSTSSLKTLLGRLLPWQSSQFASGLFYLEGLKPGNLLEIGCGSGAFLAQAARAGWTAEGIDFDAAAIEAANRRPGVRVWQGDVDHPALATERYDAIVMNHVIEHVPDPAHVIRRCHALLKPGGRLVAITPNMAAQGQRRFGGDWRGLEIPRHLVVFTAKALKHLARDAGFTRIQAFSPIAGHETAPVVAESQQIAQSAGSPAQTPNPLRMRLASAIKSLAAIHHGEFIVLVAQRG